MLSLPMKLLLLGVVAFGVAAGAAVPATPKELTTSGVQTIVTSVTEFSTKFYQTTAKKNADKNFIISTLDLPMNLAMLGIGSVGNTRQKINTLLKLNTLSNSTKEGFQTIINNVKSLKGMELYQANKFFIKKDASSKTNKVSDFTKLIGTYFQSELQVLDSNDSDVNTALMNKWATEKTNNKIPTIVQSDDVQNPSLVLLSALYCKGIWARSFNVNFTKPGNFFLSRTDKKQIPMMQTTAEFTWSNLPKEVDAKYIELPFDDATSMFIIIPKRSHSLEKIDNYMGQINFKNLQKSVDLVKLTLPKFSLTSHIEIEKASQMGIENIFDASAEFNDIDEKLKITKIIQTSRIEIDETGKEAAPADDDTDIPFTVNKPFVCAVVLKETGLPLFYAHIIDPSQNVSTIVPLSKSDSGNNQPAITPLPLDITEALASLLNGRTFQVIGSSTFNFTVKTVPGKK